MSIHAPAHQPTGFVSPRTEHLVEAILAVLVIALAIGVTGLVVSAALQSAPVTRTTSEAASLVEFRAAERASSVAGTVSEPQSILLYRAGERAQDGTATVPEAQYLVRFRADERAAGMTEEESLLQFRAGERAGE